jgi:hypothetical protein
MFSILGKGKTTKKKDGEYAKISSGAHFYANKKKNDPFYN